MSANPTVREQTGAAVMVMRQDIPLLEATSGAETGQQHIDRILEHGDTVTLGDETLTAYLTPGHTLGTTTWTLEAEEGGSTYNVVFLGGSCFWVAQRPRLVPPSLRARSSASSRKLSSCCGS